MHPTQTPNKSTYRDLLDAVAAKARASGVFGQVCCRTDHLLGEILACEAKSSAEPAEYRVFFDGGRPWISLTTPNRWLSESIETDLLHTGDKIEELLEDELVDLGFDGARLKCEHFRSEDLLFTFRSPAPLDNCVGDHAVAQRVSLVLHAYEQCFRELGDMNESTSD